MTDEGQGMTNEGQGAGAGMGGMLAGMKTSEALMNLGAAYIFVVVFVIGWSITWDYTPSIVLTVTLLSLVVLASTYAAKANKGGLGSFYPWIATTATWAIVVFAAIDLLSGLANDFWGSFYETTMYIAAAVGGVGAFLHSQGN